MNWVEWIIVVAPVAICSCILALRDRGSGPDKKYTFKPPDNWTMLAIVLGLTLLVWLSTYDTPLTELGRQREFLHLLGLGSLGLVALAALSDHVLHFFQLSEQAWRRTVLLRVISFQAAVWFSLVHLLIALKIEFNWSLSTYHIFSDSRQLGISMGTLALVLMITSWLIIKVKKVSPSIKRRVSLGIYALLLAGGTHALMIGPDFAVLNWYVAVYLVVVSAVLYLAAVRLFATDRIPLKIIAAVAAACILVGSIIVLNTRSQDGPHQHNFNQPFSRQLAGFRR